MNNNSLKRTLTITAPTTTIIPPRKRSKKFTLHSSDLKICQHTCIPECTDF
jgi:hypothetical protein